jgi:hypothetical protein
MIREYITEWSGDASKKVQPGLLFVGTGQWEPYERAFGSRVLVSIFTKRVLTPC